MKRFIIPAISIAFISAIVVPLVMPLIIGIKDMPSDVEVVANRNTLNLKQYHAWCIYTKRWDVPMDKWIILRDAGLLKP